MKRDRLDRAKRGGGRGDDREEGRKKGRKGGVGEDKRREEKTSRTRD